MRTRLDIRTVIAPVAFALLAVVLTFIAWSSFGGSLPLQAKGYRVTLVVPEAGNLQTGTAVRSAGVDIGRVVRVERSGGGARITAELDPEQVPVRRDARAAIRTKSLLGEAYVEMTLGTRGAGAVPDGGELPGTAVISTQQLDDVLSTFDPETRAGARRFVRGFSQALSGRSADLSRALGEAPVAAMEAADLLRLVDRQRPALELLIDRGGEVLSQVGAREGAAGALVEQGDALLAITARRDRALTRLVRELPGFLDEARRTSVVVAGAAPELRAAVRSLEPVAPALEPALVALRRVLPVTRALLRSLPPALRAAQRGLPALDRTLRALRPALGQLHPGLREIVPPVQFAAEDPTFLTATAANLAAAANTYVPGPGGTKQRYVRAVPMIWNEVLAGFEEPLPTSRQNQYPRPGSLRKVGSAPLESWSCRQLSNEQTVPVIPPGTGAPPCLVQGPYDYRGTRASFPRLLRAAP